MDDVIYRQDAIDALTTECSWTIYDEHGQLTPNGEEIIGTLKKIPSAQKKGHWRNYEGTLTCSVCETEFDNGIMEYCGDDVPMFCPDCGADMRGEADG